MLEALWNIFVFIVACGAYSVMWLIVTPISFLWYYLGPEMVEYYYITISVLLVLFGLWRQVMLGVVLTALFSVYSDYHAGIILMMVYAGLIIIIPFRGLSFGMQVGAFSTIGYLLGRAASK